MHSGCSPHHPIFLFVGVNHSLLISSEDMQPCILVYEILSLWMVSLLLVLETSMRARKPVELEGEMREPGQNYHRLSRAISSRQWITPPQRVLVEIRNLCVHLCSTDSTGFGKQYT